MTLEQPAWKYRICYLRDGEPLQETFDNIGDLNAARLACDIYGLEIISIRRGCTSLTPELILHERWYGMPIERIIL